MKTKKQVRDRLNDLLDFARCRTPGDHKNLGAMLLSAGSAFMCHGGATDDEMQYALTAGVRAERGQAQLPRPGEAS